MHTGDVAVAVAIVLVLGMIEGFAGGQARLEVSAGVGGSAQTLA